MPEASIAELAARVVERLGSGADDEAIVEAIDALIARLDAAAPSEGIAATLEPALRLCQKLHGQVRSSLAVPLARAIRRAADAGGDLATRRWAATSCGVVVLDTGDVVGGLQCYIDALRMAALEENRPRMSGLWNNMGTAAIAFGSTEMAIQCYQRALALVEKDEDPVLQRFLACSNLSIAYQTLGRIEEGLQYGERALLEVTPEIEAWGLVNLRRTLVRLYVASGRLDEARIQVEALGKAAHGGPARHRITADVARAVYELAIGQDDIALTRLDKAIGESRAAPPVLKDALLCAIKAEESCGNAARALLRLEELCDLVYHGNVAKAREHISQAGLGELHGDASEHDRESDRARLVSQLSVPRQPEGWKALQRLGVAAAMPLDGSGWHGVRVGALTRALAEASGVATLQAREIGLAAEVHDIGMSAIPSEMLTRHGPLTASERFLMRRHAQAGADMLAGGRHPRLLLAQQIARYHHARYDGAGYPARVSGEFIPVAARMCAIADAYDMMVCGFGGRAPLTMGQALEELRRNAGGQFDPGLTACFEEVIRSEAGGLGMDLAAATGMEDFQDLVLSLKEDRGFA